MTPLLLHLAERACDPAAALDARLGPLIRRVGLTRDAEAFGILFRLCAPRYTAMFVARSVPPEVAEEMAQETMAAVWRDAPRFDPARGGALAWLYAYGRDEYLRTKSLHLGRRAAEAETRDGATVTTDPRSGAETRARGAAEVRTAGLRRALAHLPAAEADLLRDVFVRRLSHGAIAAARGVPLGTVKARVRRAIGRLRERAGGDVIPRPAPPVEGLAP